MNNSRSIYPPQWPVKFLRFFLKEKYLEEIEGDMEEIFLENVERFSVRKAKRMYTWEMIKLLRPNLIKNLEFMQTLNQLSMFKNYFKISFRGLMKDPVNSFINVFGLALAIGFCVFAYTFAQWTFSTDQFHEHKDKVFLTTFFANRDGSLQQYGISPRPLAELLRQDFPQIKKVCRAEDRQVIVKYEDQVFHERLRYTDPAFLDMFTFPLKWGTASSLKDVNSIILSGKMSEKYFGQENPIGQSLLVKFDQNFSKEFKITGVAAKFPVARSMDFSFLVNYDNLNTYEQGFDLNDWSKFTQATFIQLENALALNSIEQSMQQYKRMQNQAVKQEWAIDSFAFEPLATLHERTDDIRDDIFREGSRSNQSSIIYLTVVCLLMLTLACFNYINIAIVSAAKRLKEIGVRKSIGATRKILVVQFLTENVVITSFALAIGLTLGITVIIPWFERLWSFSMDFQLTAPKLWIYLSAILLLTGIASGIYPAFYISRFHAVSIFKGNVKFGTRNPLTKIFLGVQLVLACIFVTSAVMFTQNTDYLAQRSWGYSPREVIYASVPDQQSYEQLHAAMSANPDVQLLAGSTHQLGKKRSSAVLHLHDRDYEVDAFAVDANYFETMGLELAAGRMFHDHEGADKQAVIINELLAKNLFPAEDDMGKVFSIDSVQYAVLGVVKDFHHNSFFESINPTLFMLAEKETYRYLSMKVNKGAENKTYAALQTAWAQLYPETPFSGGYQEDVWGFYFEEINIHGHVWRVFASVAVLLACLGLYGLVTLNVAARTKEFSIRKVLGASLKNIAANITQQYTLLFALSLGIGTPLSYVLIKIVLESAYTYHMPITIWSVALASVILIFILLATLSTQIFKAGNANPADGLKME